MRLKEHHKNVRKKTQGATWIVRTKKNGEGRCLRISSGSRSSFNFRVRGNVGGRCSHLRRRNGLLANRYLRRGGRLLVDSHLRRGCRLLAKSHLRRRGRLLANRVISFLFMSICVLSLLALTPCLVLMLLGVFCQSFLPSGLFKRIVFGRFTPVLAAPSLI